MTLPTSGQISLEDIFNELGGETFYKTKEDLELYEMYVYSQLTSKSNDIKTSDFYGYTHYGFMGWSPSLKLIDRNSQSFSVDVNWFTYGWSVTSKPSWVTSVSPSSVSNASGGQSTSVTVTVSQNNGADREGTVVATQNTTGWTRSLTIRQDGYDITVNPTSGAILFEAGTYNAVTSLVADAAWELVSKPAWVTTVSPSSGSSTTGQNIAVTVTENTSGSDRVGDIVFQLTSYPTIQCTFTLTQYG